MKYDYKIGGQVKISDRWYEIESFASISSTEIDSIGIKNNTTGWTDVRELDVFIQAYEPPKPEEEEITITALHLCGMGCGYAMLSDGTGIVFDANHLTKQP
jgi:hypothetical protein